MTLPFPNAQSALVVDPDAPELLDMNVNPVVAMRCKCAAGPTFIVTGAQPKACPACRNVYAVTAFRQQGSGFSVQVSKVAKPADILQ